MLLLFAAAVFVIYIQLTDEYISDWFVTAVDTGVAAVR
jgi:hypothetical protein